MCIHVSLYEETCTIFEELCDKVMTTDGGWAKSDVQWRDHSAGRVWHVIVKLQTGKVTCMISKMQAEANIECTIDDYIWHYGIMRYRQAGYVTNLKPL